MTAPTDAVGTTPFASREHGSSGADDKRSWSVHEQAKQPAEKEFCGMDAVIIKPSCVLTLMLMIIGCASAETTVRRSDAHIEPTVSVIQQAEKATRAIELVAEDVTQLSASLAKSQPVQPPPPHRPKSWREARFFLRRQHPPPRKPSRSTRIWMLSANH